MKLYINDFSVSCALGATTKDVKSNLFSPNQSKLTASYELIGGQTTQVFKIPGELSSVPKEFIHFNSRNNALVMAGLNEIETELTRQIEKYGAHRVGVIFGTSTSGLEEGIMAFRENNRVIAKDYLYSLQELCSPSLFIKDFYKLRSVAYTISTACSSGARTLIEAKQLIENDVCDAVIIGGADTLNDLTLNGFHSLEAVSFQVTNPFSKNRSGINIGEGAGVFIVSREESEIEIKGFGDSMDAFHISSPDPSGDGASRAMQMALKSSKLNPSDIEYINLHGTGTLKNDSMEANAVSKTFSNCPKVSSTKPLTGHTLGAAGAVELAICALSLQESRLPVHFYDGEYDPEIPKLNLVRDSERLSLRNCMSNSYAFGGNNASIVLGKN